LRGALVVNAAVAVVVATVTAVIVNVSGRSPTPVGAPPATADHPVSSPSPSRPADDTIAKPAVVPVPTPSGSAFLTATASGLPTLLPADARQVALGLWSMRGAAMRHRSLRDLRAVERGAALTADTDVLACDCVYASTFKPVAASATVPLTDAYPAAFLGEVEFARPSKSDGVDLMVVERRSSSDSWHITLVSGFPVSADFTGSALDSTQWAGDAGTPLGADGRGLAELAALWQATKNSGKPAPADAFDERSYFAGDYLQSVAKTPQDTLAPNGLRAHVTYAVDEGTRTFAVEASTGDIACGAVKQTTTFTPASGHLIEQDEERVAFGAPLSPGAYKSVSETVEWEICLEQGGGNKQAVLAWDQSLEPGVTGVRALSGSHLTKDPAQKILPDASPDDGGGQASTT
jgi:hypothetical protein